MSTSSRPPRLVLAHVSLAASAAALALLSGCGLEVGPNEPASNEELAGDPSPRAMSDLAIDIDEANTDAARVIVLPPTFSFVIDAGGPHAVLAPSVPESWGVGPIMHAEGDFLIVARQDVDPSALPADLASREGDAMTVYGADGRACAARLGTFSLVRRAYLDEESELDEAELEAGLGANDEPRTKDEIAEEAWDVAADAAPGRTMLVAKLDGLTGCDRPTWAHATRTPPALSFVPARDAAVNGATALEAFRALASYRTIQSTYDLAREELSPDDEETLALLEASPRWETFRDAEPTTTSLRDARSGREIVIVRAEVGDMCGDVFGGQLEAVFERDAARGTLIPRIERALDWSTTTAVLDVDGDGALDVLVGEALLLDAESADPRIVDIEAEYEGCSC